MKVIIFILIVLFPNIGTACSCDWVYESMENEDNKNAGKSHLTEEQFLRKRVETDLKDNKYVFRGFVYQGNVLGNIPDIDSVEYKIRIQEIYKGKLKKDIDISSEQMTSCSGPTLKVGSEYIFFISVYHLSPCELLVEDYYEMKKVDKWLKESSEMPKKNEKVE